MSTVTKHAPGTFCWPELVTTDPAAAKAFYAALFGWTVIDHDMGPNGFYHIFQQGGRDCAAMFKLSPDMAAAGVPVRWGPYVSVDSADESAKRATELGGEVIMGPFDVDQNGRSAIVRDPIGAVFSLWQAKNHIGIGVTGEAGALSWMQLNANDTARAKPFYTALLGWKAQDMPAPAGGEYTMWMKSDGPAGGMMPMPPNLVAPSHWLSYFGATNVAASYLKAITLGATSFVLPTEVPGMGSFAVLADPQGAIFALATVAG